MRSTSALTLSSRSFRSLARASTSTRRDDRGGEVEHLLELARGDVEQVADPARDALEEPDVRDGSGKVDVAHPLPAHLLARHLDAAALADDALVADALVLAAVALPVLRRAEDALAEEPVALGLERAVVDRLRLGDLAGRPVADLLARREPDTDRVEIVDVDHVLRLFPSRRQSLSVELLISRRPDRCVCSSSRLGLEVEVDEVARAGPRRRPRELDGLAPRSASASGSTSRPPRAPRPRRRRRRRAASRARGRCRAPPRRGAARRPPRAPRPRRRPRRSPGRRAPGTASP